MTTQQPPIIQLLGPVRLQIDGRTVDQFRSHRAVALLVYLISRGQAIPRSELAELLWPDNPERAAANLRWSLTYLRKLLPGCWQISRQTVRFVPEAADVDSHALHTALTTPDDIDALRAACATHGDTFCHGLYVDESPAFETWLVAQREHWRQRLSIGLETLTAHDSRHGRYAAALSYARRLLALDPWRESAHRQVMLLLARTGAYNDALAQYERCRQLLAAELDAAPQPETVGLAERIRRLRAAPRQQLPAQPTALIGRQHEVDQLVAWLTQLDHRLVSIVAPGGMGKTRLALAVGQAAADRFLEGVVFVTLAPAAASEQLAPALVESLSQTGLIAEREGQREAVDLILDALAPLEMLLILDNYEQLLPDVALLQAILSRAPGVRLLVTSRERLNMRWERAFALEGLDHRSDGARPSAAAQLFVQAARRVQPALTVSAEDWVAIEAICALAEGMPLALELAATWVHIQTPAAIAAELADNLALLRSRERDVPPRQRSMHAVFDQMWARLTAIEQMTLAHLSVFHGPFTMSAAQAVAAADWADLAGLVDRMLVRPVPPAEGTTTYFDLHELLRQYAAERLDALHAVDETARRHAHHYAARLTAYEASLNAGATQAQTLRLMQREIENIRAAWQWALAARDSALVNRMVGGYARYYQLRERVRDGRAAMARAAEQLSATAALSADDALRLAYGRILSYQARFTWGLHEEQAAAEQLAERSLEILEAQQDPLALAFVLHALGNTIHRRDLARAQAYWQRSLAIYERENALEQQARLTRNLCVTAPTAPEMRRYAAQSLALARANNDARNEAHIRFIQGEREYLSGRRAAGRALAERSVALMRQIDDPPHRLLALNVLAHIRLRDGDIGAARPLVDEIESIAAVIAIPWYTLVAQMAAARLALAEDRLEAAEALLARALQESDKGREYDQQRPHILFYQGVLRRRQGAPAAARSLWQACRQAALPHDFLHQVRVMRALLAEAETWLDTGDTAAATPLLAAARSVAEACGCRRAWEQQYARLVATHGVPLYSRSDAA